MREKSSREHSRRCAEKQLIKYYIRGYILQKFSVREYKIAYSRVAATIYSVVCYWKSLIKG